MTIPSFESAFRRSFVFLCCLIALPTQAYTEQELKAFAKLEQDMASQPETANHGIQTTYKTKPILIEKKR